VNLGQLTNGIITYGIEAIQLDNTNQLPITINNPVQPTTSSPFTKTLNTTITNTI
jgi:hydroxyethylthiazole kinase-like sugar kinase family protein